ncbi:MAG: phosphoglycerate kinase [Proteobacteria bacterium]|nr:phosphoglycerate kinase [Pseudomonadota bacterium]
MSYSFLTLNDLKVTNQKILTRIDLNVPFQKGKVTDTTRIKRSLKTIQELVKNHKVILISHLGRPEGQRNLTYTLFPLVETLSQLLNQPVQFVKDCIGEEVEKAIEKMALGDVLLLENVRFYKGEEANDPDFSKLLAKPFDLFVNDAFSVSHRVHASVVGVTNYLVSYAGRALEEELKALTNVLINPIRPVVALVGGSKISTKLALLQNLLSNVDFLVIAGGMANTFLASQGYFLGGSFVEKSMCEKAGEILKEAGNCKILLPIDAVISTSLDNVKDSQEVSISHILPDFLIVDIGLQTIETIKKVLQNAKTVIWNGPLGVFETFDRGTSVIAKEIADLTQKKQIMSVAGGGDTLAALADLKEKFSYISTAGGAFLEWLEGKELPGIKALLI